MSERIPWSDRFAIWRMRWFPYRTHEWLGPGKGFSRPVWQWPDVLGGRSVTERRDQAAAQEREYGTVEQYEAALDALEQILFGNVQKRSRDELEERAQRLVNQRRSCLDWHY